MHIFGTPIYKYTTRGLLVGEMVSMTSFLTWIHFNVNAIKYCNLFTWLLCKVSIRPRLEYQTSSVLLCSHGAYCLNGVCTRKTLNLSRLALSFIIFLTLFRVGFLNLLCVCVCVCVCDHGLKAGLHFFSIQKVNNQNKYLMINISTKNCHKLLHFDKIGNIENYRVDVTKCS